MMKKADFLHVDTYSLKFQKLVEKYWGGRGHKWFFPLWLQNSKIYCI